MINSNQRFRPPTCNENLWRCGLIFSEIAVLKSDGYPQTLPKQPRQSICKDRTTFTMKRRCLPGAGLRLLWCFGLDTTELHLDDGRPSGHLHCIYIDCLRPTIASSWLCDYFMELKVTKRYLKRIIMHVLKISWKYIESSHQNLNLHQFVMCGCFCSSSPVWCLQSGAFELCFILFQRCLRDEFDQGATRWSMSSWVIVCTILTILLHFTWFCWVSQKKKALTVWCLCFRLLCKGHKGNAFGLVTPHWRDLNVLKQSEWQASPGSYRWSNI